MARVFDREGVKVELEPRTSHSDSKAVRADERGLSLDGALVVPRADIASVAVSLHARTTVRVEPRRGAGVRCTFSSPDDARALVEALGRDPARTKIEVALEPSIVGPGFERLPVWKPLGLLATATLLVFFLARLATGSAAIFESGLMVLFFALAILKLDRTLELGTDGVRIRSMLANPFLPYRDVARAAARGDAMVLTTRDGKEIVLTLGVPARVPEVVDHVVRSIAAAAATAAEPTTNEVAARLREMSAADVAALRALGKKEDGSYRETEVPRHRLLDIVEDPRERGATRARAAVALSGALTEEDRERLRVATDATIEPKVRVALGAALDEPDERIARRLDDLDEDRPRLFSATTPTSDRRER